MAYITILWLTSYKFSANGLDMWHHSISYLLLFTSKLHYITNRLTQNDASLAIYIHFTVANLVSGSLFLLFAFELLLKCNFNIVLLIVIHVSKIYVISYSTAES